MNDIANKSIKEHFKLKVHAQNDFPNSIKNISEILIQTLSNENKLMWCGNGGSAAQAEHLSAELLGGLNKKKIEPFFSLCLNTDPSFITAWSNDSSFTEIFSRQIEAFGNAGDVLILLSTSGNSKNQIIAAKKCQELGVKVVSFTGKDGGELKKLSDFNLNVESDSTQRIQEMHILVGHIICDIIESHYSI